MEIQESQRKALLVKKSEAIEEMWKDRFVRQKERNIVLFQINRFLQG